MIYLDNASTTRCKESSAEIIKRGLIEDFFNPSAKYYNSLTEAKKLDACRDEILKMVGANNNYSVVFTGSATEANNLVLSSSLNKHRENIISLGEHASIYETAKHFAGEGYKILEASLNKNGEVDIEEYKKLLSPQTAFISIMLVSNETGAINNLKEIVRFARSVNPKVLIHTDCVQGFCKIKINMQELGVDYLTLSSHKVEGPKGVGCLVYRKQVKLEPEIFGGGQENNKRSGTENLPSILGFINSAKELHENMQKSFEKVFEFKQKLIKEIREYSKEAGLEFIVNGDENNSSPYILSCGFIGTKGEVLLHSLEEAEILVGTGSACNSKHSGNRTLSAMGRTENEVNSNIRLSFSAESAGLNPKEIAQIIVERAKKHNNTQKR